MDLSSRRFKKFSNFNTKAMTLIQVLTNIWPNIVKKWTIEFQARPHCSYAHYQSGLAEIVQIKWGQAYTW